MRIAVLPKAGALLGIAAASAFAQDMKVPVPGQSPQSPAVAPSRDAPTEQQLLEEFGWLVAKRSGVSSLSDFNFTQDEIQTLLKGMGEAIAGKDAPYDFQKVGPAMDAFIQQKQAPLVAKVKQQNAAAAADYFAKLKDDKTVIQSPSGLCYQISDPGQGPPPKPTDTVRVDYTGQLLDGTVFDSSLQPREAGGKAEPAEFRLDGVIAGWTEGLQKIGKGGKIRLYIPARLAYGDAGRPSIPPASALIFDVVLLDIKPAQ